MLPFAVTEIAQLGLEFLGALRLRRRAVCPPGAAPKQGELPGLEATLGYARAVLAGLGYGGGRLSLLLEDDPDAVEARSIRWRGRACRPARSCRWAASGR